MKLKHQNLIDGLQLPIVCPPEDFKPNKEVLAFRYALTPIENDLNFLPNRIYDERRKAPQRINDIDDLGKCLRCGMSFFDTESNARNALPKKTLFKLGYTHLAKGVIPAKLGLMGEINQENGHFSFFDTIECDFAATFELLEL